MATGVKRYQRQQRRSYALGGRAAPSNRAAIQTQAAGAIVGGLFEAGAAYYNAKKAKEANQANILQSGFASWQKTQTPETRLLDPRQQADRFYQDVRQNKFAGIEGRNFDEASFKAARPGILQDAVATGQNSQTDATKDPIRFSKSDVAFLSKDLAEKGGDARFFKNLEELVGDQFTERGLRNAEGKWDNRFINQEDMQAALTHTAIESGAVRLAEASDDKGAADFIDRAVKQNIITNAQANELRKKVNQTFAAKSAIFNSKVALDEAMGKKQSSQTAFAARQATMAALVSGDPNKMTQAIKANLVKASDIPSVQSVKYSQLQALLRQRSDAYYSQAMANYAKSGDKSKFEDTIMYHAARGEIEPELVNEAHRVIRYNPRDAEAMFKGIEGVTAEASIGGVKTPPDSQLTNTLYDVSMRRFDPYKAKLAKSEGGRAEADAWLNQNGPSLALLEYTRKDLGFSQDEVLKIMKDGMSKDQMDDFIKAEVRLSDALTQAEKGGFSEQANELRRKLTVLEKLSVSYNVQGSTPLIFKPPPEKEGGKEDKTFMNGIIDSIFGD